LLETKAMVYAAKMKNKSKNDTREMSPSLQTSTHPPLDH